MKIYEEIKYFYFHIILGKEVFRDILGYEGYYEISNLGNVKTTERQVKSKGGSRTVKSRILKPAYIRKYANVFLSNGKVKRHKIHRLVAQAFKGLDINDPNIVVRHKDDKTYNNYSRNLKLGTQTQNMKDKIGTKYKKN